MLYVSERLLFGYGLFITQHHFIYLAFNPNVMIFLLWFHLRECYLAFLSSHLIKTLMHCYRELKVIKIMIVKRYKYRASLNWCL